MVLRIGPEARHERLYHHVANELAAHAGRGRCKRDGLPIAAIQTENHVNSLIVITSDLEAIRAIALIAALRRHDAFMCKP